jgi:hypothetical protein
MQSRKGVEAGPNILRIRNGEIAYAVVMVARKLWYYFKSHKITVPTSHPLRDMFENREAFSRIGKWLA